MKKFKLSLFAVATMALTVFSGSAKASDYELGPLLKNSADKYIVPYMSRWLEKDVRVTLDRSETRTAKLDLYIPDATCNDYNIVLVMAKYTNFSFIAVADILEKNPNLTFEQLNASGGMFRAIQISEGAISAGLFISQPEEMLLCQSKFEEARKDPRYIKLEDYIANNLVPRFEKLHREGRFPKKTSK